MRAVSPPALPPRMAMRSAVDVAPVGQVQGRIEAVLGVGHPPEAPEGVAVGPAVARAAGVVDAGGGESPGGEELDGQIEPGLAARRRAAVAPDHAGAGRRPSAAARPGQVRAGTTSRTRDAPTARVKENGSPRATSAGPQTGHRGGPGLRSGAAPAPGRQTHTAGGASGVAPIRATPSPWAHTAPMATQGWEASLGPARGRVHARPGRHGRPRSGAGRARRRAARPWSPARAPSRARGTPPPRPPTARPVATRGQVRHEGLPPAPAVRDEAQAPVGLPGRLPHRLPRAAGHQQGLAHRRHRVRGRRRAPGARRRPRACPGGPRPRRPPGRPPGSPRRRRRSRDPRRAPSRPAPPPGRRPGPPRGAPAWPHPSAWTSRTARTQRPSAVAPRPPWRCCSPGGASSLNGRGEADGADPPVTDPHPLVASGPRRRRRRRPVRGRDTWPHRRTRAPGCGCSRPPANGRPRRRRPTRTSTTRPPSAGRDSSQYSERPSEHSSESDDFAPGDVGCSERRRPTPVPSSAHRPQRSPGEGAPTELGLYSCPRAVSGLRALEDRRDDPPRRRPAVRHATCPRATC